MSEAKIVWSEGMFLRPQHFQQQDRYLENFVRERSQGLQPYQWGFKTIRLNEEHLLTGKFSLTECSGIFQEGTPFILRGDTLPAPIDIPDTLTQCYVYLALPTQKEGATEIQLQGSNLITRYGKICEQALKNTHAISNVQDAIEVVQINTRLLLEKQDDYYCLAVACVTKLESDKKTIQLEREFIAPSLDCHANLVLKRYLDHLLGLLQARGKELSQFSSSGRSISELAGYLMLQIINRAEPLWEHLSDLVHFHPESFYREALQLAGELSTFGKKDRRPISFPSYNHEDLQGTFSPLMKELKELLTYTLEQRAIQIPLSPTEINGILYHTLLSSLQVDRMLLLEADFVLVVTAKIPPVQLQHQFPAQLKISYSISEMQKLVQSLLPGIPIQLAMQVPPQLHSKEGASYFILDKKHEYWKQLQQEGKFLIHITGDYEGLELQLWAIK
jgi:type VI secretion system protein ImpJ